MGWDAVEDSYSHGGICSKEEAKDKKHRGSM